MTLWELSDALTARYFSNLMACRLTDLLRKFKCTIHGPGGNTMLFQVTHTTRYLYQSPVAHCLNEMRVTPRRLRNRGPETESRSLPSRRSSISRRTITATT